MVVLDVTVFPLGRFLVDEEFGTEEVLLLPSTGEEEMKWLEDVMKHMARPYATPKETLLNALAVTYHLDESDCVFHTAVPLALDDKVDGSFGERFSE